MGKVFSTKKSGALKYVMILIGILVVAVGVFVFLSPQFEQDKPLVSIKDKIYWNLQDKLSVKISDKSGIKYYKITYNNGAKDIELLSKVLSGNQKELVVNIPAPKFDIFHKGNKITLNIEVVDNSKWNYLNGNKIIKKVDVTIDIKKPIANVINNSRYIRRGGSGIVIVKVQDQNLQDAYISFNNQVRFELFPFMKPDYFIALIAWDVEIKDFKKISLVAIDKANNKTVTKIPFYIQKLRVKKDNIKISKKFIENVSTFVLEQSKEKIPTDLVERFLAQNETLRAKNIQAFKDLAHKAMDLNTIIDKFNIKRFKRLRGSRTAAGFAERRSYFFEGKKIDEAWHLGMDWASVKNAPIKVSNSGKVIFNEYLGIYGNTIIIDHGLGLFSLYAHTSSADIQIGDDVKANQKIANTGTTGAVMGDHLHFGILIQGIEVNPLEWMDRNWIKTNILKTITQARKEINQQKD